jgi:NADH-quinone oxidoreductase E subunit
MLTKENIEKVEKLRKLYPTAKALTLPVLWLVQEQNGWLSEEAMKEVAELLGVPLRHILGVASFYTMYNPRPVGRYHIQVCTNISCQLLGSESIMGHLCRKLGVKPGETTPDGQFTLSEVECLGSCGTAPMMQVNNDFHENLNTEKLDILISEWSKK